jgi:hypothetical protein
LPVRTDNDLNFSEKLREASFSIGPGG